MLDDRIVDPADFESILARSDMKSGQNAEVGFELHAADHAHRHCSVLFCSNTLESVSKLDQGLHSFRSMRRMEARATMYLTTEAVRGKNTPLGEQHRVRHPERCLSRRRQSPRSLGGYPLA
jgi:hypothetical protein